MTRTVFAGRSLWQGLVCALICATFSVAADSGASHSEVTTPAALWLKMPLGDIVPFAGIYDYDSTGIDGQFMQYNIPAGNVIAGLLAAAVTHGAMANAANENKKKTLIEKANKVLQPYDDILKEYRLASLAEVALQGMRSPGVKAIIPAPSNSLPEKGEVIEFAPAFYMTQDQRALVLDTTVQVWQEKGRAPKQILIHMVSPLIMAENLETYWKASNGLKLKEVSARLLSRALDLALADAHSGLPAGEPMKTVRYFEGNVERFERGQPIALDCNQLLMRNLRGNLVSVPVKPGSVTLSSTAACQEIPFEAKSVVEAAEI